MRPENDGSVALLPDSFEPLLIRLSSAGWTDSTTLIEREDDKSQLRFTLNPKGKERILSVKSLLDSLENGTRLASDETIAFYGLVTTGSVEFLSPQLLKRLTDSGWVQLRGDRRFVADENSDYILSERGKSGLTVIVGIIGELGTEPKMSVLEFASLLGLTRHISKSIQ